MNKVESIEMIFECRDVVGGRLRSLKQNLRRSYLIRWLCIGVLFFLPSFGYGNAAILYSFLALIIYAFFSIRYSSYSLGVQIYKLTQDLYSIENIKKEVDSKIDDGMSVADLKYAVNQAKSIANRTNINI